MDGGLTPVHHPRLARGRWRLVFGCGFLEPLPDPPLEPAPEENKTAWVAPEWMGPADHVVGGHVPFRASFVHDDRLCIRLDQVEIYPAGLMLQLELHLAEPLAGGRYVAGMFPWAVVDTREPARYLRRDYQVAHDDLLRFGVRYQDGRSVVTRSIAEFQGQHGEHAQAEQAPDHPLLLGGRGGSGGGGGRASMSLWVWPLPPVGEDLELVIQWPVFGIHEATVTIPGAALAAGYHKIEVLWPETNDAGS